MWDEGSDNENIESEDDPDQMDEGYDSDQHEVMHYEWLADQDDKAIEEHLGINNHNQ